MCLHGILGVSPEGLYGQVLLYPLEERLYLPAVAVQIGHVQRSYFGEVGDEDKLLAAFEVGVLHHPEGLRVEFCGLVAGQSDDVVAAQSCGGVDVVVGFHHLVAHVALCPRDPIGVTPAYIVESREVHIGLVHHINRPWDYFHDIQHVAVVPLAVGNIDEGGDAASEVEDCMHLDRTSVVLAVRPCHQLDTARHGGGVNGKNLPTWKVDIRNWLAGIERPDNAYQHLAELLPDAAVAVSVCPRQR